MLWFRAPEKIYMKKGNIEEAKNMGAMALFGEKYGDLVRVVKIGKSIEFCGGTHTTNTKNIKAFAITNVESKGSNVYRIEGTTNDNIEPTLYNIIKPFNDEIIMNKFIATMNQIDNELEQLEKFNIDEIASLTMTDELELDKLFKSKTPKDNIKN